MNYTSFPIFDIHSVYKIISAIAMTILNYIITKSFGKRQYYTHAIIYCTMTW